MSRTRACSMAERAGKRRPFVEDSVFRLLSLHSEMLAVIAMREGETGDDSVVDGCENSTTPDYESVEIPPKPPAEYSYHERRGEIQQLIRQAGHPSLLNQSELGDRYGVTQQTISKDMARVAESVHESLGDRDRRAMTVDSVVQRSIRGLLDEEEYRKAAKTAIDWDEWVTEFHELTDLAERLEDLEERQERAKYR